MMMAKPGVMYGMNQANHSRSSNASELHMTTQNGKRLVSVFSARFIELVLRSRERKMFAGYGRAEKAPNLIR
jgi:hypothetical protein